MLAIPVTLAAREVDPTGRYVCPACKVQPSSAEDDPGWVLCPMLDDAAICLGCCIDVQQVARSSEFSTSAWRDLFDDIAALTGERFSTLRQSCLAHQAEIVESRLRASRDEAGIRKLQDIMARIRSVRPSDWTGACRCSKETLQRPSRGAAR